MSYTLLDKVRKFLDIELDLEELRRAGDRFEQQATEAIASQKEVVEYVRRLEEAYDASQSPEPLMNDISGSDEVIHDLEEFLKSQRPSSETD